jgi:release factor glutamine methyltransferase
MSATVAALLASGRRGLVASLAGGGSPGREAALLLADVLGSSEAKVLARPEARVEPRAAARFLALIERRSSGEPVAYLLGRREFWGRSFQVDDRVLIPRPETEHLIEEALRLDLPPDALVLDLCTGSGCLAATLALERPDWRVVASDLSIEALVVAIANALRLGAAPRVRFAAGDLATALRLAPFDLVVCNPPYVDGDAAHGLPREVAAFEPALALYAADRGLATLRRLLDAAGAALAPRSYLLAELGAGQAEQARDAAARAGLLPVRIAADLNGIPRVLIARR